jgi:hypothetical protein
MPNQSYRSFFCTTPGCILEGRELDAATAEDIHYRCIACKGPLISAKDDAPPGRSLSELPSYLWNRCMQYIANASRHNTFTMEERF